MKHIISCLLIIAVTAVTSFAQRDTSGSLSDVTGDTPKVDQSQTRKEAICLTVPDDFRWVIPTISQSNLPDFPLGITNEFWIYTKAMSEAPPNSRLWFVLNIPCSGFVKAKLNWEVNCYFMPTNISGRLCRGSAVHLNSRDHSPEQRTYREGYSFDYWHVLPPDQGFTSNAPPTSMLPFTVNGNLDDHTIVQIADIMRELVRRPISSMRRNEYGQLRGDMQLRGDIMRDTDRGPILSMTLQEDGRVRVSTATSCAFLAGRGMIYILEKRDGDWIVVKTSHWVS